ncbi:hypothetical protein [Nostoc sp.]
MRFYQVGQNTSDRRSLILVTKATFVIVVCLFRTIIYHLEISQQDFG